MKQIATCHDCDLNRWSPAYRNLLPMLGNPEGGSHKSSYGSAESDRTFLEASPKLSDDAPPCASKRSRSDFLEWFCEASLGSVSGRAEAAGGSKPK